MPRRRGRAPTPLPAPYDVVHKRYAELLATAPLAAGTREEYASRVRCYLAWLAQAGAALSVTGDPLTSPTCRDGAVRDYRIWLKTQCRSPATVNNSLAALTDFYGRIGLGAPHARSEVLPLRAPVALDTRQTTRYLRAVEAHASPRDRAIALLPYYAGLRIGEVVALDLADLRLSVRRGEVVVGKGRDGGRQRILPVHATLRTVLATWLEVRAGLFGADATTAVFLNHRGGRITGRAARTIITDLGAHAALTDAGEPFGPHTLRHTFATQMVRDGVDLVIVADLLGHTRLETTRLYTQPTAADRAAALTDN
jgi:site-specific recombinase XerD